ncbi:glycosyltransferase [Dysgonomonas sp. HDW5B]|uniref:glycosyltransferase n=1 Tax=Dysgonomonas sp. HDW5B TaxID=2714927 RepID=UPI00140DBABE|nr:glycosyltransferase [Dysgonomonas sp. HDW5B]QIK54850.1 glycosyltransferase [Dysgonomonas sp. HDW5B]
MKGLFLIFHGMESYNGISKKIRYQVDGFKQCGVNMQLCYIDIDSAGNQRRMIDNDVIESFDHSLKGKFKKWTDYSAILEYIEKNAVEFVYIRSYHNANPFLISAVKHLKKKKVKVVLEIPTYPYDQEYRGATRTMKFQLMIDQYFRKQLAKHLYAIVTFSDHKKIFGTQTINISNGIDFNAIRMKSDVNDTSHELHLISVAEIHPWHGFDRLIAGLANYYKTERDYKVYYDIVGYGVAAYIEDLKKMVENNSLGQYVRFHGSQFGEQLDKLFDNSDIGIASLARHRSNITHLKALKNREYAARGIPFIYSEIDDDFEAMPYVFKASMDESPIDIDSLIEFYRMVKKKPSEIRQSVHFLSWEVQIQKVVNAIYHVIP